jgi:hypothetical protein
MGSANLGNRGTRRTKELGIVARNCPSLAEVSIPTTFYLHLFHLKVLCAAFLKLQLGFVIIAEKECQRKTAPKMLMKLTTGCDKNAQLILESLQFEKAAKNVIMKKSLNEI